ncbi:FAD:protein FMN transferase [Isoptericola sp. b441]|uniref:FAD:protein FMN transferase n=1 Tax=Actinotalea lenta TaxID=3064654 RepID=A0ABT9D6E5_9CELL|nr:MULTISPECIES: FAD:protein FMN transferase [unclassified Isoptericola]MDO8106410.1 FAD:protein FMN transferase [Isoptericola sp. b441]MDO8121885.1 FAD:protein FMN transferase [Isoptericola sp. b490]
MTPAPGLPHRAWVEQIMGMPISVHVRGPRARDEVVAAAVADLFDELRAVDARFSPYREDSELRHLQRGEVDLADASDEMREVERLCRTAWARTDGWFDAWHSRPDGLFDPTGLTKTWGVARAARHLDRLPGLGYAIGAGGDVLLTPPPDGEPWLIGIEDPRDRSRVLATVPVSEGAVATSGTAARGAHILDPRTGAPTTQLLAASVVGPSLLWADVFATAAIARGASAVDWVSTLHGTSGLLVLADGSVHRWANAV